MTEEIWKPIINYEGSYEVSNLGRIRSIKFNKLYYMSLITNKRTGYKQVLLCKNGVQKTYVVHRLVALSFLENPLDLPCINHKDENKLNNRVDNLEWCTIKYNNNYGTGKERSRVKRLNNERRSKAIKCIDLLNNTTTYYPSISQASRELNLHESSICRAIRWQAGPYLKRYLFFYE